MSIYMHAYVYVCLYIYSQTDYIAHSRVCHTHTHTYIEEIGVLRSHPHATIASVHMGEAGWV